jgi:hypothetical protein
LVVRLDPRVTPPERGSRIWVTARAGEAHLFDAESGERLAE